MDQKVIRGLPTGQANPPESASPTNKGEQLSQMLLLQNPLRWFNQSSYPACYAN